MFPGRWSCCGGLGFWSLPASGDPVVLTHSQQSVAWAQLIGCVRANGTGGENKNKAMESGQSLRVREEGQGTHNDR